MTVQIINSESIDSDYDSRHGGSFFYRLGFIEGSYFVYKEYPAFCEQDALDLFADWAVDNAKGFIPNEYHLDKLRIGAINDNRTDSEDYVNDFYMRAGSDSHWIETPALIEFLSEAEVKAFETL